MDLFELLFIALFILFPIMEGVLRRKKRPGPGDAAPDDADADFDTRAPARGRSGAGEPEPGRASDMVPEDLWAVLTGEESPTETGAPAGADAPADWDREPATMTEEPTDLLDEAPDPLVWQDEPEEEEAPAPASAAPPRSSWADYKSAEVEALDSYEPTVVSLEKPLASAEARHRRFHELIDRPEPRPRPRRKRTGVGRALRRPDSLRQAVVLSEVLGPPKGLE